MRALFAAIAILLCIGRSVQAEGFLLEGKISYFRPTSSDLKKIFGSAWLNAQIEISQSIWECLNIYASANFLHACGCSIGGENDTKIRIIPMSLGLKYLTSINSCCDLYVAAATRYFFLRIENDYPFVKNTINKHGLGGVVEAGGLFYITPCFFLDVFADYSFKKLQHSKGSLEISPHSIEVGGLCIGAGIGYNF